MEKRRVLATVTEEETCPMYMRGDAVTFSLPGVILQETASVCALAIANLVPVVREFSEKTVNEAAAMEPRQVKCPGCGLKCTATFRVESLAHIMEAGSTTMFRRRVDLVAEVLGRNPIFNAIPTTHYESLLPLLKERTYPDATNILVQGGDAQGLFLVVDGEVDVLQADGTGEPRVIATKGAGECFGEMSLITGERCTATVRTKAQTRFLFVEPRDFRTLIARFPSVAHALAKLLARRLASTSQRVLRELETGIIGKLDMIEAPDLIQALSLSGRTGTLLVRREGEEGRITMRAGQLLTAQLGERKGRKALFAFLKWRYGVFRFEPNEPPDEPSLGGDTMALLLEGMRQADEAEKK